MRCFWCKRAIRNGQEAARMVQEYKQPDGSIVAFGYGLPAGPIKKATGKLYRSWHNNEYHIATKHEQRGGDAVNGAVTGFIPNAYELESMSMNKDELSDSGMTEEYAREHSTLGLVEQAAASRAAAREHGTSRLDHVSVEAEKARKHDGKPYDHRHVMSPDPTSLIPHLKYAHGVTDLGGDRPLIKHGLLHATMYRDKLRLHRESDPGYEVYGETDWRDQSVLDIDQVIEREDT